MGGSFDLEIDVVPQIHNYYLETAMWQLGIEI
jgi:hypothetical protein